MPKTLDWIKKNKSAEILQTFIEYDYIVNYHFGTAKACTEQLRTILSKPTYQRLNANSIRLTIHFPIIPLLGDTIIRELLSATEMLLPMENYLFALKLSPDLFLWKNRERVEQGKTIKDILDENSCFDTLCCITNSLYGSDRFNYLRGYRNWVTHRGAPVIAITGNSFDSVELPTEIVKIQNEDESDTQITNFINLWLLDMLEVRCFPFLPRVADYVRNYKIENIEKGKRPWVAREFAIITGDPFEKRSEYRKKNKEVRMKREVTFAGEKLAVYNGNQYLGEIETNLHFISEFMDKVDSELARLSAAGLSKI